MSDLKTTTFALERDTFEKFRGLLVGGVSTSQVIAEVVGQLADGKTVSLPAVIARVRKNRRHIGRPSNAPDTFQRKRRGRTPAS